MVSDMTIRFILIRPLKKHSWKQTNPVLQTVKTQFCCSDTRSSIRGWKTSKEVQDVRQLNVSYMRRYLIMVPDWVNREAATCELWTRSKSLVWLQSLGEILSWIAPQGVIWIAELALKPLQNVLTWTKVLSWAWPHCRNKTATDSKHKLI